MDSSHNGASPSDFAGEEADYFNPMDPPPELLAKLEEEKSKNPGMFVSAWQDDEADIEKDQNDPLEIFLTAAEDGNLDLVKRLLEKDSSIDQDKDGYTALHRASYMNHLEVVSYLLEYGANAESRTKDGWTPLLSAANWANYRVIGRLLSHKVDANAVSNGNVSALHLAIKSNTDNPEDILHSIRYLLQAPGIDAGVVSGGGDTPLMLARRSNKLVYELLQDHLARDEEELKLKTLYRRDSFPVSGY